MDDYEILTVMIAIVLGTALRTLLPWYRKQKIAKTNLFFDVEYVVTAVVNATVVTLAGSLTYYLGILPEKTPVLMTIALAFVFGYAGNDLTNEGVKYYLDYKKLLEVKKKNG